MDRVETIAIIGGGMAGLSAGCFLAQKGINVKLFEANDKLGGACATTNVSGYTFNDGALYLALPGMLDHVFERLQIDRAAHIPLRKLTAVQTTTLPDGTTVTLGEGLALTINGRAAAPDVQRELHDLVNKWTLTLRFFAEDILVHPFSLARLAKGWRHLFKLRGTVATELDARIRDKSVRAALSGALLFAGLPPEKQPILSIFGLISMLDEGLYLPKGGMGKIPDALHRVLKQRGGEIYLNAKIKQISVRGRRARGVEVEGRGLVEADAVLSTASGMATFGLLLNPEDVPGKMRRKVQAAPLSHRALSIQLGLANKIDAPSHLNAVLPWMPEQNKIFAADGSGVKWPSYSVPTVTMPELAPAGGSIVELYVPAIVSEQDTGWDTQKAERITEAAIETLSRFHKVDIAAKRVRTPKDFQNEMHLYRGAVYGLSPAAAPQAQFPHSTPLPGLYLAGQTTYPGFGVGPAAMSGIFAAEAILEAA